MKISIDRYATSFWDESEGKWCAEEGIYTVRVATGGGEGKEVAKVEADLVVGKTEWWMGL